MNRRAQLLLVVAIGLVVEQANAVIVSSGDVKPPFALTGPSSSFTVPTGGSTGGGVIVGDVATGTLTIDDAWTLNSTYGIIAHGAGSGSPVPAQLLMSAASTWNITFDLDIGNAGIGSAQVQTGSAINARAIRIATATGSTGTFQVNSSSTITTSSGTFVGVVGNASMTVSSSSIFNTDYMVVADQFNATGLAQFSGGSHLNSAGGVLIGGRGLGNVSLTSGSTAQVVFTSVGQDPDSPGQSGVAPLDNQITISGVNTFYDNAEGFIVGYNTKGSATVEDGARLDAGFLEVSAFGDDGSLSIKSGAHVNLRPGGSVTTPSLIFAATPGSIGAGLISDAGTVVNVIAADAFAEIARGGTSAVNVTNGAVVNAGSSIIATEAGSNGNLVLSGAGTAWNTTGTFEVGRGGNATMTVQNGAALNVSNFLIVGSELGSSGQLTIDGAGTTPAGVSATAQGIFGIHGQATAVLQNGGRLNTLKAASATATSGLLAQFDDSTASVTVRGAGSLWSGDGGVNVGFRGHGSLAVETGGSVESVDGILARLPGSTGNASVSDTNSKWVISNDLYVGGRPASSVAGVEGQAGPGGTARLAVGNGSRVNVGHSLRLFSGGEIDVSGGGIVKVGSNGPTPAAGTVYVGDSSNMYASGTIKGALVNDGDLYVGESIGTLNVQGFFRSSETLHFDVASTTSFDRMTVTGAADLGYGLKLNVIGTPTFTNTDRVDLITAGSVTGYFSRGPGNRIDATHWLAVIFGNDKVTLALAQPGDATLDGAINFDDLLVVAMTYGGSYSNPDWSSGDFDANGIVDFTDLLKVAQRYGTTYLDAGSTPTGEFWSDWALARSLAPEPGTLGLIGVVAMPRRRR